jgi:hypothetical protein
VPQLRSARVSLLFHAVILFCYVYIHFAILDVNPKNVLISEELVDFVVSALGVRSWKLNNVGHWMGDQKLITFDLSVLWKAR